MSNKRRKKKPKKAKQKRAAGGKPSRFAVPKHAPAAPAGPRLLEPHPGAEVLHLDAAGGVIRSDFEELGLDPADAPNPETIRAVFRARLSEIKAEFEPDRVRCLREARDRLLDPKDELYAHLHTLALPKPEDFGLPPVPDSQAVPQVKPSLSAHQRIYSGMLLYALLEEELEHAHGRQAGLFD